MEREAKKEKMNNISVVIGYHRFASSCLLPLAPPLLSFKEH